MLFARLLSKIYKKKGIVLIDSQGQKYICGKPNLQKPLTLKLSNKELNWKLVLNPDLNFPEAYMHGEIEFENGSLLDFLNMTFENIGRNEINIYGSVIKKFLHAWRFITNYNLISGLHSFMSIENEKYKKILPPLSLLSDSQQKELMFKLEELEFFPEKNIAA